MYSKIFAYTMGTLNKETVLERVGWVFSRPQANILKNLPKMLLGISQNFYLLCSSCFPLCLYYASI